MGRPAITSFTVREEHSVLKFGMGGGIMKVFLNKCCCFYTCKRLYCNNKLN
jgi:hypothetical protein